MRARIHLAVVAEVAAIERVREYLGNIGPDEGVAFAADDAALAEESAYSVERGSPCGVKFEGFLNDGRPLAIDDDLFCAVVVEVADGALQGNSPRRTFSRRPRLVFSASEST